MTDPEHDDVFEAYLKHRTGLPALDDKLEPPATLDQLVLNQAREAIQPAATRSRREAEATGSVAADRSHRDAEATGSVPADRSRREAETAGSALADRSRRDTARPPRWAVPVALAATVLLCLSVVMNISLNTHHPSPNFERMAAARADLKASALQNATAESDASAGVSGHLARDALDDSGPRAGVSGDIASREVVLPEAKVAGGIPPHAPVVAEASVPPPSTAASSSLSASARTAPQLTVSPQTEAQAGIASAQAGNASARSGALAATPTAAKTADDDVGTSTAADKAVLLAKKAAVVAPEYTPAPELARIAARQDAAKAAAVAPPHPADPKVWLQQIDALRAAGKADQADAEMRRFKAAFPDYALPKSPRAPDPPLQ